MKIQLRHKFEDIISLDNLLCAWQEFLPGKRSKKDVQEFALNLADNILQLHSELANKTYKHGGYKAFNISDPKPRQIHKAPVRDRILHHAIYRLLYPFFDKLFIVDSYSCRVNKGTHKAMQRFQRMAYAVSKNHTQSCWVLKCDIKKFFASIDHQILVQILNKYISDRNIIELLLNVIDSFSFYSSGKGLPLGNLTSQLFCNVYMNEFDQFLKHKLRVKHYVRYADDFVLLSEDREWLTKQIPGIAEFLEARLKLVLHPDKILIKTFASGVDFLGWVHFPKYKKLRTTTKRRILKRIVQSPKPETLQSYLGLMSHGQTFRFKEEILNLYALNKDSESEN